MQVHIKLYGPYSMMAGKKQFTMNIEQSHISVEDFLNLLLKRMPKLQQVFDGKDIERVLKRRMFLVINGSPCSNLSGIINNGDQVQVLTPIAGG